MAKTPTFRFGLARLLLLVTVSAGTCGLIVVPGLPVAPRSLLIAASLVAAAACVCRDERILGALAAIVSFSVVVVGGEHVRGPLLPLAVAARHMAPERLHWYFAPTGASLVCFAGLFVSALELSKHILFLAGTLILLAGWWFLFAHSHLPTLEALWSAPFLAAAGWCVVAGVRRLVAPQSAERSGA